MDIMKNVTEGIEPFQQALYNKVLAGGFDRGEMTLYSAGRQTGKSTLNYYYDKLRNNNLCKEILLPMKPEPTYRFSRAKWYEATLSKDRQDAFFWCVENFGAEPKYPDAWSRWYLNVNRTFRFRDEQDYMWFVLRWA